MRSNGKPEDNGKSGKFDPWEGFDVIHRYTRAQAIADGVLVDITEAAKQSGCKVHVAMTAAAYAECVEVPQGTEGVTAEDRLTEILNMVRIAAHILPIASECIFPVILMTGEESAEMKLLKLHLGGGDDGEPVLTILLPNED
jgi:hypothetical protein